jgi:hypothetical protein
MTIALWIGLGLVVGIPVGIVGFIVLATIFPVGPRF